MEIASYCGERTYWEKKKNNKETVYVVYGVNIAYIFVHSHIHIFYFSCASFAIVHKHAPNENDVN